MKQLSYDYEGPFLKKLGRGFVDRSKKAYMFTFSASGFEVRFKGTALHAQIIADQCGKKEGQAYLAVVIDDSPFLDSETIPLQQPSALYTLAQSLPFGEHKVAVYKRTEASCSYTGLQFVECDGDFLPSIDKPFSLEIFGDSITAGNGDEGVEGDVDFETRTENALTSYGALASERLGAAFSIVAIGGYPLVSSPWNRQEAIKSIPMMFSMADFHWGDKVSDPPFWDNASHIPDVVVINLGTNDDQLIRDEQDPKRRQGLIASFQDGLKLFLDRLFACYGNPIVIVGTGMIKNEYVDSLLEEGCRRYPKKVYFLPFHSLEVGGFMPNGGHPNRQMHIEASIELAELINRVREKR